MKRKMMLNVMLLGIICGFIISIQAETIMLSDIASKDFRQVKELVNEALIDGGNERIDIYQTSEILPAGTVIEDRAGPVTEVKNASWFIFADDLPGANWTHPCRYILIQPGSQEMHIIEHRRPPEMIKNMKVIHRHTPEAGRELKKSDDGEMQRTVPSRPLTARSAENLWSVIISGGGSQWSNYPRYWNDISSIYKCLVNYYEYLDDHIYVLCSDGTDPAPDKYDGTNSDPDLDGDGDDDIIYSATVDNLQTVFDELQTRIGPQDLLFVYATDHGDTEGGWDTVLVMWNSADLQDNVFADMLDQIECRDVVTVWEQCYSGGFLDDLNGENRVFASAARYDEVSWAMAPDYIYDEFVFHWTAAVNWEDAYGNPVDADTNNDGIVDMNEAFIYAEMMDTADETPQYDELPAGYGATISLWGSGPNSEGALDMDKSSYSCNDTIILRVMDLDLSGTGELEISVESDTEPSAEAVTLAEIEDAVFQGSIDTAEGSPSIDGILQVAHDDLITARYLDEDYGGTGPLEVTAAATADCEGPVISIVEATGITDASVIITWTTDELCDTAVTYGTMIPPAQTVSDDELVSDHSITLTGLNNCTSYFFQVSSTDEAGNERVDDNGGQYYSFMTIDRVISLEENMDSDPDWNISGGQWAWGQPTGGGGAWGDPDPDSGYTNDYVYGYNLNGDYTNYMSEYTLTTPAIDCSNATGTTLEFQRWLGVEENTYDHARVKISTNGTTFQTIWENGSSDISDAAWVHCSYDISQYADGEPTVYIQWTMGPTDGGWVWCGWNIDDVRVSYLTACDVTPTPFQTYTPTQTPTQIPTSTPTFTPTKTATPSPTPTRSPTRSPSPIPTSTPTRTPTQPPTHTPTHTPTGIPPTLTPTDGPSQTPTAIVTGTPPFPYTPTPTSVTVHLLLNQTIFHDGDQFQLQCRTVNPGDAVDALRFIILDIYQNYWYHPEWSTSLSYESLTLQAFSDETDSILEFTWPPNAGYAYNLKFWAAYLNPDSFELVSNIDSVEWGYE